MADIMNTTLGFQIAKVNLVEVVILTHLCHYIMQLQHFLRYAYIKKRTFQCPNQLGPQRNLVSWIS